MDVLYECGRCQAIKTRADLRQVTRDETCLYACRQCGAEEGTWLWPVPAAMAPERPTGDGDRQRPLWG